MNDSLWISSVTNVASLDNMTSRQLDAGGLEGRIESDLHIIPS